MLSGGDLMVIITSAPNTVNATDKREREREMRKIG